MQLEDADKVIKASTEILQAGNTPETCAKAVAVVADALGDTPPAVLEREVRAKTLQPLTGCLHALTDGADAIDDAGKADAYAAMRKLIDAPATGRALGKEPSRVLLSALDQGAGQAMQAATRADLKSKSWEAVAATIRKWRECGAVTPKQADAATQSLRDSVTKDLLERGKSALGQNAAEPVLADVERGIKLLGNGAPQELKALQGNLATWIECKRLSCKPAAKPKVMFSFGTAAVLPLDAPRGQAADNVPNATKFWVLASGGGLALVAREDPGEAKTWSDKLIAAKGWVEESALQAEDTSSWLPVGKALESMRVWLPTDKGDGLYLLGIVQTVSGKDVTVKRLADGQAATVKRDVLRTGNLRAGLKVLAFCSGPLAPSPARFEEVVPTMAGNPIARVTCLKADGKDDQSRNEVIGSLRSKAEWLPPRRP
jgi:hypothetical protein